jgi:hypothetical protein
LEGKPWSLDVAPWWREPLQDLAQHKYKDAIFYKSRKVFATTTMTVFLLWLAATLPYCAIAWLLPRWVPQGMNYSRQVLHPLLKATGLEARLEGKGTERVKVFSGDAPDDLRFFYIYGVASGGQGDDMAAAVRSAILDFVNYDERQQMGAGTEDVVRPSMLRSNYQVSTRTGTPNVPAGILDDIYAKSDQREWMIRCPDCDWDRWLDEDCMLERDDGPKYWGCPQCGAELDRASGRWVPQKPENSYFRRGYHMVQAMLLDVEVVDIEYERQQAQSRATYYQETWGRSYTDVTIQPWPVGCFEPNKDRELILGALPAGAVARRKSAGIDPGKVTWCWVDAQIGERRTVLLDVFGVGDDDLPCVVHSTDPRRHMAIIAARLLGMGFGRRDVVVCDWGHSVGRAADLRAALRSEVWECRYMAQTHYRQPGELVHCPYKNDYVPQSYCNSRCNEINCDLRGLGQMQSWDLVTGLVTVDKAWAVERRSEHDLDGRSVIPFSDPGRVEWAFQHFHNVIPLERERSDTGTTYKIYTRVGKDIGSPKPDHLAQCAVYSLLGLMGPPQRSDSPMIVAGATVHG